MYPSSMLDKRVTVLCHADVAEGEMGRGSCGDTFIPLRDVWASVAWNKGMKAMREGAMDAYDYIMVRTAWHPFLTRDCRLRYNGRDYRIESFYDDFRENQIQITAVELDG